MRQWFSRCAFLVTLLAVFGLGIPGPHNLFGYSWPLGVCSSAQAYPRPEPLPTIDVGVNRGNPATGWFGFGVGMYGGGSWLSAIAPSRGGGGGAAAPGGRGSSNHSKSRGGSAKTYVGDPINYAIGNAYDSETDYTSAGSLPLVLARYYNSDDGAWRMSYSRSITYSNNYTVATVTRDDGQVLKFTRPVWWIADWTPPAFSSYRLYGGVVGCCALTLTTDEDEIEVYDGVGKLASYSDRAGLQLSFSYDGLSRLSTVTDPFGRTLTFLYDSVLVPVSRVQTPDGGVYSYQYDLLNRLTTVTYPGGSTRRYVYEDVRWPGALTGVFDENGSRYSTYAYDTLGRAVSTQLAGGAGLHTLTYSSPVLWNSATVTTPLGATKRFTLTRIDGLAKPTAEWRACADCSPNGVNGQSDASAYDTHGNLKSYTDFKGYRTTFEYDEARHLPTSQTLAVGTPLERTIRTEWRPDFRLPKQIVDRDRIFDFDYDSKGNLKTSKITSGTSVSTWGFTYDTTGRFLTAATDPRGFQTRYAYDMNTGNLTSVTNALGDVTRFSDYDANGRPRKITDPNNVETTLTYNFRGQITSRLTIGQTTSYIYDKVGQLTEVREPSGVVVKYAYDAAHRLEKISDRFGNYIRYTLDAAGNRTKEQAFDPAGALARTHRRVYDGLERLYQDFDASEHVSTFSYDANDNLLSVKDANNNTTAFGYDALNRLEQVTEPEGSARTRYGYDALGRLASVTDPRGLVTRYVNNRLDLPEKITSPDSGVTDKTYDAAGNVKTSKDARGQTTSYLYDELNRRVKATHADGSVITFVYDQGTNGKGRLTSMTDPTGTTSWTYDGFGHVLQKKQVTGAVTLTTSWAYDAATGRLSGMTYPSGYKILYTYDAGARMTKISLQAPGQATASSFIDQIAYSPFGAVASWRLLPSGRTYLRDFDNDGRIASITSPTGNVLSYTYDAGSRISRIAESGRPDKTFFYDRNNRLKRYVNGASAINYGYDASGNRTADDDFSYAIAPTSNRIASRTPVGSTTAQTLFYDAAGGMENNGGFQLRYDERNRLDRVIVGALTTTYGVNGLGERVAKDGPPSSGKVEFVFDLSGGLLGQYNASGAAAEEIVWLGGLPVGTIQGGAAYHIAADHLGAPHQIVNSANVSVWFWDHEPFGDGWPVSAPGFTHRLRFPGQIYDIESNLHSNGHRDYDPRLGRYVESDPIGLEGGINTYAYAGNDPVNAIDPSGLDPKSEVNYPSSRQIWGDTLLGIWQGIVQGFFDFAGGAGCGVAGECSPTSSVFDEPGSYWNAQGRQIGPVMLIGVPGVSIRATEELVPASTPIGRLGNPINVRPGTNAETVIGGRQFGGHSLDQMQGRGVMPSAVENTVRVGRATPDPIPGRIRYYDPTNNLTVITESNGRVVTVITGKR
jgi:RHS repeat-associated protein